jgi:hypothetical protein
MKKVGQHFYCYNKKAVTWGEIYFFNFSEIAIVRLFLVTTDSGYPVADKVLTVFISTIFAKRVKTDLL